MGEGRGVSQWIGIGARDFREAPLGAKFELMSLIIHKSCGGQRKMTYPSPEADIPSQIHGSGRLRYSAMSCLDWVCSPQAER